jgi:hypothetical protein
VPFKEQFPECIVLLCTRHLPPALHWLERRVSLHHSPSFIDFPS